MAGLTDPFELLGLPRVFSLAPDAIHAAHLARAAAAHPDIAGDGTSMDDAANEAAALNRAKDQLLDAESRGNVLLELLGGPTKEQDKTLPPDFLMEMMETREEIEGAMGSKDPAQIARWTAWAHEQREALSREVGEMFERMGAAAGPSELRAIRVRLNVWRYIERLVEQLQPDYHGLRDRAKQ
jgi:DnaJ-domain-containing protein 1